MAWIGVLMLLMLGHLWWALLLSFIILMFGD
jgi:hypothetical protein